MNSIDWIGLAFMLVGVSAFGVVLSGLFWLGDKMDLGSKIDIFGVTK